VNPFTAIVDPAAGSIEVAHSRSHAHARELAL